MGDKPEEKFYRIPYHTRPPVNFGDGSGARGYTGSASEEVGKPAPRYFTWDNARDLAIIVRGGLLMIVKGFEKYFDLGKK